MDPGSIMIGLALALVAGAYVARPLFMDGAVADASALERRLSELYAARDRVLTTLEELDLDFAMGKLLEADYRQQRQALVLEGAEVLRSIDELQTEEGAEAGSPDLEAEIEAAVARLRSQRAEGEEGFCPACGARIYAGDQFCVQCGASLVAEEGDR